MRRMILQGVGVAALAIAPSVTFAQMKPAAATYITDEEVKTVNALPGVDRTIRVVDIGPENFSVGIIHRGPTGAANIIGVLARLEHCTRAKPNVEWAELI